MDLDAGTRAHLHACGGFDGAEEVSGEFLDDFGEFEEVPEHGVFVGFHALDHGQNDITCFEGLCYDLLLNDVVSVLELL